MSLTESILQRIDEALYLMRKRSMEYPNIFSQNVIILDRSWSELVLDRYRRAMEKRNYLSSWKCPKELLAYCLGDNPLRDRTWVGAKFIYAHLNVRDSHWVGLVIDISHGEILVLDCASSQFTDKEFEPTVEPYCGVVF